jgi:signal transduction histidine kinase
MEDLAALKADKIEAYFAGLRAAMETARAFYNIEKNLPTLIHLAHSASKPEFLAAKKMLDAQLRPMQKALGLADIMLVSSGGKIVYSSNPEHAPKEFLKTLPDPAQQAFRQGKTLVYVSDVFLSKEEIGGTRMLITGPAYDLNQVFSGVIVFEVNSAPVYKLLQEKTGLGATGEILLSKKVGDKLIYLTPLKYAPDAAFNKTITIGSAEAVPSQKAVQGQTGSGRSVDYRGSEIIAGWRYLPSLDWGIVVKMDAEEAFAAVTHLRRMLLLILAILVVVCGITAVLLARSISDPIEDLSEGAKIIGGGNLDYKVGTANQDEIGRLSRAFDAMTGNLKKTTASRDELNKEIGERKKTEEMLKQSNESLEQFAYVASHDLQEPLRVMASYSELLERRYKGKLDSDADEFIEYIVDGAKRMQRLINDLLNYSRVGGIDKNVGAVDCNSVLASVISGMRTAIEESKTAVSYELLPELTGRESDFVQLFQNLIGNGIKFRGPVAPRVHIKAERQDAGWLFSVKDNGIGLEPQYKDRIFLIFQRLHGKSEYPGTGIGLAVCKKIVEAQGGRIWVESEPGKGAVFYFTLPARGELNNDR